MLETLGTVCGVDGHTLSVGFHSFRFEWMNLSCGEGGSLSEEPPPWLGILAKISLVSECVERACVR